MSNGRARRSSPMVTDEPPDREAVEVVLALCRDARERNEAIPNAVIAEYAEWAGTSAPTFRRWIRNGRPEPARERFEIDKEFEQELALHRTIAHTVRKRANRGIEAPVHVRTYQRAVKRKLRPYVIVALRKGEKAATAARTDDPPDRHPQQRRLADRRLLRAPTGAHRQRPWRSRRLRHPRHRRRQRRDRGLHRRARRTRDRGRAARCQRGDATHPRSVGTARSARNARSRQRRDLHHTQVLAATAAAAHQRPLPSDRSLQRRV